MVSLNFQKQDLVWLVFSIFLPLMIAVVAYFINIEALAILAVIYPALALFHRNRQTEEENLISEAMQHPEDWVDAYLSDGVLSTETCLEIIESQINEAGTRKIWYADYNSTKNFHREKNCVVQIYDLKIRKGIGNALLVRQHDGCYLVRVLARPQTRGPSRR